MKKVLNITIMVLSLNNGTARPIDPFYNFKDFLVGSVMGHRPTNNNPVPEAFTEPVNVQKQAHRKPIKISTTRLATATTSLSTTTTQTTIAAPTPDLSARVRPFIHFTAFTPFVHLERTNLSSLPFSKPEVPSFYTISTKKPEVVKMENMVKVNSALVKVKNVIEAANIEQGVINKECFEKLVKLEALMEEMLQEMENFKVNESKDNLKLMEKLINDITEEMVASVQAHLAKVLTIEKLEQMKELIRELAKGVNDETVEIKLNDTAEQIVKIKNTRIKSGDELKESIKLDEMKSLISDLKIEDMRLLVKELSENSAENELVKDLSETDVEDVTSIKSVEELTEGEKLNEMKSLIKELNIEDMMQLVKELSENAIEEDETDIDTTAINDGTKLGNNPDVTSSVENVKEMLEKLSDSPREMTEKTKSELNTLEKLNDAKELITEFVKETISNNSLFKGLKKNEKVEKMKKLVQKITFKTEENLRGESTDNIEEMKNLIGQLKDEAIVLEGESLTDDKINGIKEIITDITENRESVVEDDEVGEILNKLDEMADIINGLMEL